MAKARTELIHCENCGEDYAATYRRCPFCNARGSKGSADEGYEQPQYGEDDYDYEAPTHRGGKRLAGGRAPRSGNGHPVKTVLYLLSSLVILAAIWIMCSMLIPRLLDRAPAPSADADADAVVSEAPVPTPDAPQVTPDVQDQDPDHTWAPLPGVADDDPLSLDSPDLPSVEPDPLASPAVTAAPTPKPSTAPASGLRLSSADFTLNSSDPTYRVRATGAEGTVSFSIKDQSVATVSDNGTVTAVGNGWTTLTATDAAGKSATCIVRVAGMNAANQSSSGETSASGASSGNASSGNARLNLTDFSISADYPDPIRLRVVDGQAASWRSKNESVATVSENGTVSAAGNGYTQIICTLSDGSTLSCDVHVSGK